MWTSLSHSRQNCLTLTSFSLRGFFSVLRSNITPYFSLFFLCRIVRRSLSGIHNFSTSRNKMYMYIFYFNLVATDHCCLCPKFLIFRVIYSVVDVCPKVVATLKGTCLNSEGKNQNDGEILLNTDDQSNCLELCRKYPGGTGCQFSLRNSACYVHTKDVAKGGSGPLLCWIFSNCQAGTL